MGDNGAGGQMPARAAGRGRGSVRRDVGDFAALLAEEMGVKFEIRAIAGGLAVVIYGADEAALGQGLEAIVNCGEGDAGEFFLDSHENVNGGGVIAGDLQGVVNFAALGGETEPFLGYGFVAVFAAGLAGGFREHWLPGNIEGEGRLIKNNSK